VFGRGGTRQFKYIKEKQKTWHPEKKKPNPKSLSPFYFEIYLKVAGRP
jgi:hypothetical protein